MIVPIVARVGAATDTGLKRAHNEDSHLAQAPLFLVADGMGGHQAGDRASMMVVREFQALLGRSVLTIDDVGFALAHARAAVEAIAHDGSAGAGTTLSGVAIAEVDGSGYWLAMNIGDSRTYRYAHRALEQISVDHSVVQELIDAGELGASEARHDRRRNIITRAIGAGSTGEADFWMIPAAAGDRILICSDGLSSEVDDQELSEMLAIFEDPQAAAERLVARALELGGRDNVTAVVVDAIHVSARSSGANAGGFDDIDSDTRPRAEAMGGMQ
ncbi:protein phosphatase 2C domain-containing protein [Microbacterium sp. 13-71-7]|jgi:protein phosphatase|uniref:PP2C family protein-serine/threonine phosphatase n=1 Tax=Microbacterium sp. 13-71-7 TaxID=1970399 RepID=UPI000BCD4EC8|nr:protein phosphatase 2C domain-containing protein [Microbacterium sp. 13-71-7]OZB80064.1 MAG: serine/threonine protein phosphatase [Microbacterium sp. 13-71-7]